MDTFLKLAGDGLREWFAFRRNNPDLVAEDLRDRARRARQRSVRWEEKRRPRWARRARRRAERLEARAREWDAKAKQQNRSRG